MIHITNNESNIVVKSDPVIVFDNGMQLWLGKKGERFVISSHDYYTLLQITALVGTLGKVKDRFVEPTPKVEKRNWFQKLFGG